MLEPPLDLPDEDVLDLVRRHWRAPVDVVTHLPVGFGAHHWRASAGGVAHLFVTVDGLGTRHSRDSLEAAYAGAAHLAHDGLDLVHPSLPSIGGPFTVPAGPGLLSVTAWLDGTAGDGSWDTRSATATRVMLDRLHAAALPPGLPRWRPLVGPDLAERLAERTAQAWPSGPHGEEARSAIRAHLDDIAGWTADYHRIAATSDRATWVATHGEPHTRNQLTTRDGRTLLVDWESVKLAPAERDLRVLPHEARGERWEPHLVRMFDLEWRLDEVAQYAAWFEAAHTGTDSDRVALGGLRHELVRPPRP